MSTGPNTISIAELRHKIGKFQLGPVSFDVPEGSITALIGPNGAGKTTLLDLLYGMGKMADGAVTIGGLSQPHDEIRIKQRVGYVTPDVTYASGGRIGAALDYISGFYPNWDAAECERLLAVFGLDRKEKVGGLSFGGRMKLSLVAALARDTDALLLDEPTTGLDVSARQHLFAELLRYIQRPGRAVLISSHQLSDLERLADRVAVLFAGQMLALGSTSDLVDRYQQWDIAHDGSAPLLPADCRVLVKYDSRLRVMADLWSPQLDELAALAVISKVPMTLEEIYLGLTERAQ